MATVREPTSKRGSGLEVLVIVAVALGLALLIQAFVVKPFRIPSPSMVPTLAIGQRVLVDRVSGHFSDPERGDVVVFRPPAGADTNTCASPDYQPGQQACPLGTPLPSEQNFIKRIVGEPGDRISIQEGRVLVNGERQNESFIQPDESCESCNLPAEITVPPGHYFMMGDNRGESADSRYWGPVPEDWIVGNAFATYWPPSRIGGL